MTGSLWFYSKDKVTDFNANIVDGNAFKSFKSQAKLLGNIVPDGANGNLRNTKIAAPLKYLSNFWRSLKMSLINSKVEVKLKWMTHCGLYAGGADNTDVNSNNIIFTTTDTKLYVPVVTSLAKYNQKLPKLLNKDFERSVYWDEYKQENKNPAQEYRYFLELNFVGINRLFALTCWNKDDNAIRYKARRYYLPIDVIKNYNLIVNWKNFYDRPIDANKKQYKEIRKLKTS